MEAEEILKAYEDGEKGIINIDVEPKKDENLSKMPHNLKNSKSDF